MLALAVVFVVAKVLLPTSGITIATAEIKRYPYMEFVTRERVSVLGHLMNGSVLSLESERERNASKAKWLRRSYVLVCAGLLLVAFAGIAGTLDRYVV